MSNNRDWQQIMEQRRERSKRLADEDKTQRALDELRRKLNQPTPVFDPVSKPAHYNTHPSGVECKDIIRHFNYNIGAAVKYLWRNGLKDEEGLEAKEKQIQDLGKAIEQIQDEIQRLKGDY